MYKIVDTNAMLAAMPAGPLSETEANDLIERFTRIRSRLVTDVFSAIDDSSEVVTLRDVVTGYEVSALTKDGYRCVYVLGGAVTSAEELVQIRAAISHHNSLVVA
jgi:hypothetical protein